jgi:hypothetical protein
MCQIGNGIIDYHIQAPHYPRFATENTYGIVVVNETIYNYMNFALNMDGGCLQDIEQCRDVDQTSFVGKYICQEAQDMCRDNVEGKLYLPLIDSPF